MSDNWKDKIKNTEVNPPGDGWNGIAASLDESLNGLKFPVSLYNHEVDPPAAVWNNIESDLDEKTEPLKRPYVIPPILKDAMHS